MTGCLHPLCDPEHTTTGGGWCVERVEAHARGFSGVCGSSVVWWLVWVNWIVLSVVMAEGERPVPSRTRKLSPPAPMVLHPPGCGRVGRRRHQTRNMRGPTPTGGGPRFCIMGS